MKRILCIDDEPCRYDRFYPMALHRGLDVVISHDPTLLQLYFAHPLPGSELVGVCLDHDMPLADGHALARSFLIERGVPVAVVSTNEAGRNRIARLLEEYDTPCSIIPATVQGWEQHALTLFQGYKKPQVPSTCLWCGRPIAALPDYDLYKEGEGEHLCWDPDDCEQEADVHSVLNHWKNRAVAAEALLREPR